MTDHIGPPNSRRGDRSHLSTYYMCVCSAEDDRRFRTDVTGDSAESALLSFFTLVVSRSVIFWVAGRFTFDRLGSNFVMQAQARSYEPRRLRIEM